MTNFFNSKILEFLKTKPEFLIYWDANQILSGTLKNIEKSIFKIEEPQNFPVNQPILPGEETFLQNLGQILEKSLSKTKIKNLALIFSAGLAPNFTKWVPALTEAELQENLPLEIEEETGKSAAGLVFAYKIKNQAVEKGIQKIKVEIFYFEAAIFQKIKSFFKKKGCPAQIWAGHFEPNPKNGLINLNDFVEFKKPMTPAEFFNLPWPAFKKLLWPAALMALIFLAGQKWLLPKPSQVSNLPAKASISLTESTSQDTVASISTITPAPELTSKSGEAVFTYPAEPNSAAFSPEPRLSGLVTGTEKIAVIQIGADLLSFKAGEKISEKYFLKEILEDRIIISDKNKKSQEIFLNPNF